MSEQQSRYEAGDEPTTVGDILRAHGNEQSETAHSDLASGVATYYRQLTAQGVPDELAGQLTIAYQTSLWQSVTAKRATDTWGDLLRIFGQK